MKRLAIFMMIFGLLVGTVTVAEAGKRKKKKVKRIERVAEVRYEMPSAVGTGDAGGVCVGCPAIPNGPKETWMKVEIIDDTLPLGGVDISFCDCNGDGFWDPGTFVCGESEWIQVPPGSGNQTFPWLVSGSACPGGGATSGTIKVTFSNMPGK